MSRDPFKTARQQQVVVKRLTAAIRELEAKLLDAQREKTLLSQRVVELELESKTAKAELRSARTRITRLKKQSNDDD